MRHFFVVINWNDLMFNLFKIFKVQTMQDKGLFLLPARNGIFLFVLLIFYLFSRLSAK